MTSMPLLASLYAAILIVVALFGLSMTLKDKDPLWYVVLDFAADIIVPILFSAYWLTDLARAIGSFSLLLFLFSLIWFTSWTLYHAATAEDKDFSPEMNLRFRRFYLFGPLLVFLPGFVFGAMVAFKSV